MAPAVADLFVSIGVPQQAINQELAAMSSIAFGRTESRALLGNLNDLLLAGKYMMNEDPRRHLADVALFLSDYLVGPQPYRVPRTLGLQLLSSSA
jgi:hypothetical protein